MGASAALTGRITETIKLQKAAGKSVVNFKVVCNSRGSSGEYISCTAWGSAAENFEKYTHKNMLVEITGRLKNSVEMIDGKTKVVHTYVLVDDYNFLEARRPKEEVNLFNLEER